jgi:hypothetical protein
MVPTSRVLAVLAPLVVLTGGCGESRQAKLFHEIAADCDAAAASGMTLDQAANAFRGSDLGPNVPPICLPDLLSIPAPRTDTCGPASEQTMICQVVWEWVPTDSGLCQPGGGCCLICEVRVRKADFDRDQGGAVICASRGLEGQFCQ